MLVEGIVNRRRVRLAYSRQSDGVTSIHEVAPIDVQPGDTPRTADVAYLWAWCFAEAKLERHLMDRVLKAELLEQAFDPEWVLAQWPYGWPRPNTWQIPRDW